MFKTNGVALHPGIGHSRGMFSCLRIATACFNGTTHGCATDFLRHNVLVVHVLVVRAHKLQGSASPCVLGSVTTSPFCKCTAT